MKVLVFVTLKKDVLDPQGRAVQRACMALGYEEIHDVRQGKVFEIELREMDHEDSDKVLDHISENLLANPIIEDCRFVYLKN